MHQLSLQLLPLVLTILEDLRSASETAQRTLFAAFQVTVCRNIAQKVSCQARICMVTEVLAQQWLSALIAADILTYQ
jgi:hypothetical protein